MIRSATSGVTVAVNATPITIPTESIGSIPRPTDFIERVAKTDSEGPNLAPLYENAIPETMERFEATGSVDPILGPRKKCATVRSNPARIDAAAREAGNFLIEARYDRSARQPDGVQWLP